MDAFPRNTCSSYRVKLAKEIVLGRGKWEVALASMSYPRTWYNLSKDGTDITYTPVLKQAADSSLKFKGSAFDEKHAKLPAGHYQHIESLISEINTVVGRSIEDKGIRIRYEKYSQKVTIELKKHASLKLSEELSNILGFAKVLDVSHRGENDTIRAFVGDRVADINGGYYNIMLYANIIEEQIVGDSLVPLLKSIPMTNKQEGDDDYLTVEFDHLQWVPVKLTTFDEILIELRRDDGTLVPFERGVVSATLVLRRAQLF